MTDRPIIFSAPVIQSLLDGRKTQTRRLAYRLTKNFTTARWDRRFPPDFGPGPWPNVPVNHTWTLSQWVDVRPGDTLWVREGFVAGYDVGDNDVPVGDLKVWYRATDGGLRWYDADSESTLDNPPWRSPIQMPRWASRLTLTVTDVRVQRLRDISEDDAIAEGIKRHGHAFTGYGKDADRWMTARDSFASLWTSIHGPDAWDRNDWVCALTFTVEKRNINAPAGDEGILT